MRRMKLVMTIMKMRKAGEWSQVNTRRLVQPETTGLLEREAKA